MIYAYSISIKIPNIWQFLIILPDWFSYTNKTVGVFKLSIITKIRGR